MHEDLRSKWAPHQVLLITRNRMRASKYNIGSTLVELIKVYPLLLSNPSADPYPSLIEMLSIEHDCVAL